MQNILRSEWKLILELHIEGKRVSRLGDKKEKRREKENGNGNGNGNTLREREKGREGLNGKEERRAGQIGQLGRMPARTAPLSIFYLTQHQQQEEGGGEEGMHVGVVCYLISESESLVQRGK